MPGDIHRQGIKVRPTASAAEAQDLVYELLVDGARRTEQAFTRPTDDWRAMWIILTGKQGTLVTGTGDKRRMTEYVGHLARRFGAHAIGHLHSSWAIDRETAGGDEEFERHLRIVRERNGSTEGLPRREVLLIATYSAAEVRHYLARIHRAEDAPPTLGPFDLELSTAQDDTVAEGAMVDPLIAALTRRG